MSGAVVVLGIFVADASYRADRLPVMGETLMGRSFTLGPGGKGSNQAVAAAKAGAEVHMITRLGRDTFADLALDVWSGAGVTPDVIRTDTSTGSAFIFVDANSGDNAIIVAPGAAGELSVADVEGKSDLIGGAAVFITQLEQPIEVARRGLELARAGGATTILNPAPAAELPDGMLALCDFVTPNESETAALTGDDVRGLDDAEAAARHLLDLGVGAALITLGENGVYLHDGSAGHHIPARAAGPVVETTGAGDAFNGGFAAALAAGASPLEAARFGCATAGLSVTRPGAAASMPTRDEIDALLNG